MARILHFRVWLSAFVIGLHFWAQSQIMMHPNRGQWEDPIAYKVELDMGEMLIENRGITYHFYHWHHPHHCDNHEHCGADPNIIKTHVVKTHFINSQVPSAVVEENQTDYYRNYYLGDDESKWKSGVHGVLKLTQKNIYPNIDLVYEGKQDNLKYSFVVQNNANPNVIQIEHVGADKIEIDSKGRLIITTSLGEIIESKPVAWTQNADGKRSSVKCKFKLEGNIVSFELGSYNASETLIIDPELAFSTFTGATSDNWGFTACPDNDGNLYGGGIVFGAGYPVTPGAYDMSFNGGTLTGSIPGFDVSITKFNATGSANLFSTFLGGNGNEVPTSLVTNNSGQLFVLSITSSTNFPTTAGAFQTAFAGGPLIGNNPDGSGVFLEFNGSDLAISRFNANGTALLASTYIGGSGNDGLNYGSNLNHNYGDNFRGEIIVDNAGGVYFSSTTRSTNFPVAANFGALAGAQDAVYGKLPENLGTLNFCRYYGGNGMETGNSIQISPAGDLYVTGATTSNGNALGQGGLSTNYIGATDAYVIRVSSTTGMLLNGTYLGTPAYDQGYFVQTDLDNNVYVFGQSRGGYPNTPGVYGNPGAGQFIHKLSQNLTTTLWSTTIGNGAAFGSIQISPTAFLVSNCYEIYIAGWGGQVNWSNSIHVNQNENSNGMPVTPGAYQATTNGNNVYLAVLRPDATGLKYGTYMGGIASSFNHVDGGTSRFSKEGTIYHAVCGSCGATNNGFTTTPGVYAPNSAGPNCNLAAFKFNLSSMEASIGNVDPIVCIPNPVQFINNSSNGNFFIWNFGDGSTSNLENPTHSYTQPGNYTVQLIVVDTLTCYYNDTVYFDVFVGSFQGAVTPIAQPVCPEDPVQLNASGGLFYSWFPAGPLNNPNIPNPIATVLEPTLFTVVVSDTCGSDTLTVLVDVYDSFLEIIGPDVICIGQEATFSANLSGLQNIQWLPPELFGNANTIPVTIAPESSVTLTLTATSADGCPVNSQHFLQVDTSLPAVSLADSVRICSGASATVTASGGSSYIWQPAPGLSSLTGPTVTLSPSASSWYYVEVFNACGGTPDSVFVEVVIPNITAGNDTIICPGEIAFAWAGGGVSYVWEPQQFVTFSSGNTAVLLPQLSTTFTVYGTDQFGCVGTADVFVELFPLPFVTTSPNVFAFLGDPITISAQGNSTGIYYWAPTEFLTCPNCQTTGVNTNQNMTYTVHFIDENGCKAQDQVSISFDAIIYVPNTFTPDGNRFNPVFLPQGGNIAEYQLMIFNRWGELIFESFNFKVGWDGTYDGKICQDGTYVWVIEYTDVNENRERLVGHINLLR
jgi:gliding motility-associated-like protein